MTSTPRGAAERTPARDSRVDETAGAAARLVSTLEASLADAERLHELAGGQATIIDLGDPGELDRLLAERRVLVGRLIAADTTVERLAGSVGTMNASQRRRTDRLKTALEGRLSEITALDDAAQTMLRDRCGELRTELDATRTVRTARSAYGQSGQPQSTTRFADRRA